MKLTTGEQKWIQFIILSMKMLNDAHYLKRSQPPVLIKMVSTNCMFTNKKSLYDW